MGRGKAPGNVAVDDVHVVEVLQPLQHLLQAVGALGLLQRRGLRMSLAVHGHDGPSGWHQTKGVHTKPGPGAGHRKIRWWASECLSSTKYPTKGKKLVV